ncbi:MAG: hypothetical protein MJH10_21570, partial [Epibacterium sp.]|nr:hypothetical protein [Epibacterium sp.]NQX76039.1 hypothetical protein [Epibacterium sp.]
ARKLRLRNPQNQGCRRQRRRQSCKCPQKGPSSPQHNVTWEISDQFKLFIGRTIRKVVEPLYERIKFEARRLNLYTYELRYGSKAGRVLLEGTYDLIDADRIRMEILTYFAASKELGANGCLMRDLGPLSFDLFDEGTYVRSLPKPQSTIEHDGEVEALYEKANMKVSERLPILDALGQQFYEPDEEE